MKVLNIFIIIILAILAIWIAMTIIADWGDHRSYPPYTSPEEQGAIESMIESYPGFTP